VQVADPPADSVVGVQERDDRLVLGASEGAESAKIAFRLIPDAVAVTVTFWLVSTSPAVTLNAAFVVPCGTLTEPGMVMGPLPLASETCTPPAGAG
jgi:hypothetical protein